MDQYIGNHTHEDTIRDAVGQRHKHDTDKTRYSRYIIGEINLADIVHHHDTHQNQCRSCSLFRNSQEQWGKSSATAKQMAAVKLVSPERPPTFTPEALST